MRKRPPTSLRSSDEFAHAERPRLFIGSSGEGLAIALAVRAGLGPQVEATVWHQGVFGLSRTNIENLTDATDEFDFAVLVLTPDDLVTKRGRRGSAPRDNVLFEARLFMRALGRHRTFLVCSADEDLDLPFGPRWSRRRGVPPSHGERSAWVRATRGTSAHPRWATSSVIRKRRTCGYLADCTPNLGAAPPHRGATGAYSP